MNEDDAVEMSPLSQVVSRDGLSIRVDIYKNEQGRWLLELVDEYGNSTVWDAPFKTDQAALDEALDTIDKEGLATLIGPETGFTL